MTINGQDCSNKEIIVEEFINFIATVREKIEQNIRKHEGSHYRNYLTNDIRCNFAFYLVDNNATMHIIKNTKISTSKGHDGISLELLKLITNDISKCITVIINQSLTSGIFPNSLKIAKVTPIFKKENNKLITNYRPISVLPVISKVFETVIHEQLSECFMSNNLFCPQQYGFRKNSSTELAALELLDRVLDQIDKHKIPINFHIDLWKAFDSLRHDILLDKLTYYGVTHPAKKLIESYLSNRKQFVQVGNIKSTMNQVSTGVPQGSIVGPLLFNICINDIAKASSKFAFILYADDTTLNSTLDLLGNDTEEIQNSIISELKKVFKWLDVNKLRLNVSKSKFMLFQMPQKRVPHLLFSIDRMHIEQVTEFNFLGLIMVLDQMVLDSDGFRSQHSTELACVKLVDYITTEMDNIKKIKSPTAIFLDLSNFNILLNKLQYYGIHGISLSLIRSYLTNRFQYVQFENSESDLLEIKTGIPQGSILGPLFFNIMINDIVNSSNKFNFFNVRR